MADLRDMFAWIEDLVGMELLDRATEEEIVRELRGLVDAPDDLNAKLESGELRMAEFMERYEGVKNPHEDWKSEYNLCTRWPWLFAAFDITHALNCSGRDMWDVKWAFLKRADPEAAERIVRSMDIAVWEVAIERNPDALLKRMAENYKQAA